MYSFTGALGVFTLASFFQLSPKKNSGTTVKARFQVADLPRSSSRDSFLKSFSGMYISLRTELSL